MYLKSFGSIMETILSLIVHLLKSVALVSSPLQIDFVNFIIKSILILLGVMILFPFLVLVKFLKSAGDYTITLEKIQCGSSKSNIAMTACIKRCVPALLFLTFLCFLVLFLSALGGISKN